ncbi:TIGR00266 family protein [Rhizocola hellebori]|uniref:TIGR00266 family protein n=1 Tax=Rhizocola hellebori TaxID=1392758 RepID=A0A8J3QG26_9ACTN|nr:TIGR00266 family protein [Rhizocola hellebori]
MPDSGEAAGFSYRVDYRPAYAVANIALADGQSIKTEAGAMVSMSANLELDSKMEGGLWSAVKRSVGGRSAFVSTYTARGGVGELMLAPGSPGDIVALRLTDETVNIAASSYLASDPTLEVDTDWGGAKAFFASKSMFVLQVRGSGVQFVTAFGTLHPKQLAAGERYVVDTGHLIAWHADMQYSIRKVTKSLFRSMTSGEVLVAEFTGPGRLLLQTRNLNAFADALIPFLPDKGSGVSIGEDN